MYSTLIQKDAIRTEIGIIVKDMRGISPKTETYANLKKRLDSLNAKLGGGMERPCICHCHLKNHDQPGIVCRCIKNCPHCRPKNKK